MLTIDFKRINLIEPKVIKKYINQIKSISRVNKANIVHERINPCVSLGKIS